MFESFFKKPVRMTAEQAKAEEEAIRLLTHAQKLLMDDPKNADEAKRIRFEVTNSLLPPKRMYIIGKHPKSLLLDVDRRIQHAYITQIRQGGLVHQEEIPVGNTVEMQGETKRACDFWSQRYGSLKGNLQRQFYWSLIFLLILTIFVLVLIFVIGKNEGASNFSRSFQWLVR